jgi:hypothetical protein
MFINRRARALDYASTGTSWTVYHLPQVFILQVGEQQHRAPRNKKNVVLKAYASPPFSFLTMNGICKGMSAATAVSCSATLKGYSWQQ